jgi:hypothetical protein
LRKTVKRVKNIAETLRNFEKSREIFGI